MRAFRIIICFWVCICLLTSCTPSESEFSVHEIAKDYLLLSNLEENKIVDCEFEQIQSIDVEIEPVNLIEILSFVHGFLSKYYVFENKENSIVEENDLVGIDISEDASIDSCEMIYVFASEASSVLPDFQKALIGKRIGEAGCFDLTYEYVSSDDTVKKTYYYEISFIGNCIPRSEPLIKMLQDNGFYNPIDLFSYAFETHYEEKWLERQEVARIQYLSECLKSCSFVYSSEEIKAKAEEYLLDYRNTAEMLSMTFEQYYEYARNHTIGRELNEDPYVEVVEAAQRNAATILFIGVMAQKLNISISDQQVNDYYRISEATEGEIDYERLRYFLLEDLVIATSFPKLKDSRMIAPSIYKDASSSNTMNEQSSQNTSGQEDAVRDYNTLLTYINRNKDSRLSKVFAGAYIEDNVLVVLLTCPEDAMCLNQLKQVGLITNYSVKEGKYTYADSMKILEEINVSISKINTDCLNGSASSDEAELMKYWPRTKYDDKSGVVQVLLVTETEHLGAVVALFNQVVGTFPEVVFVPARYEDVVIESINPIFYWKP